MFKFILPATVVGTIVGEKGANQKYILSTTGALIHASKPGSSCSNPRDRLITIASDTPDACKAGFRMMLELIQQQGSLDQLTRPKNPEFIYIKQVIPGNCAGKILGPQGEQILSINNASGASLVVEAKLQNAAFCPFRTIVYRSQSVDSLCNALDLVSNLLEEDSVYMPEVSAINSVVLKIIKIPGHKAGSLLGPGGSYIVALQEVLKVKMGICESFKKDGARFVSIYGQSLNVKVATDVVSLAAKGVVGVPFSGADSSSEDRKPTMRWDDKKRLSRETKKLEDEYVLVTSE